MGRPKKEVSADQVLELASQGVGLATMAKTFGYKSYEGFRRRLDSEPELREAYEYGVRLADEELASVIRAIITDPNTKEQNRIQAYDKFARHVSVNRIQEMQKSIISHMTPQELVSLYRALKETELEERLSRNTQTQEDEQLKVSDAGA